MDNKIKVLLKSIITDCPFTNPKPIELLMWALKLHPNKNAIVLDFYAGSGTTGHAVMELNREDGGNREFILCTNNEISEYYMIVYTDRR